MLVPNTPLRKAVLASDKALSDVCRTIGWFRHDQRRNAPDTARLKRALGILPSYKSGYAPKPTVKVNYGTALAIVRALDFDPVDFGL